jgi:hypothetical protein
MSEISHDHKINIGALSMEDHAEFFAVIAEAFGIHCEKEEVRRGHWKKYPSLENARHIRTKVERIITILERAAEEGRALNDAEKANVREEYMDIIVYDTFGVRTIDGPIA